MGAHSRVSIVVAAMLIGVWGASCSSSSSGTGGTGGGGAGADAGTGSGGTDAGGVNDGGTDAGSGGGGGGDTECAGVVPSQIGSSFSFDVPASGSSISCDQVFSDESGNLAASGSRDLRGIRDWHLFDSNGAALTKIRASDLFGQGPGYEGLSTYDTVGGEFLRVAYWTPEGKRTDGSPVSGDRGDARAFRAPGGILVVKALCEPPFFSGTIDLRRRRRPGRAMVRFNWPLPDRLVPRGGTSWEAHDLDACDHRRGSSPSDRRRVDILLPQRKERSAARPGIPRLTSGVGLQSGPRSTSVRRPATLRRHHPDGAVLRLGQ